MRSIRICPGKEAYIPYLIEIERETSRLFPTTLLSDEIRGKRLQPKLFKNAIADNLLWVALEDDLPVGFSLSSNVSDLLVLVQFHIHPEYSRRGLGTRLLSHLKQQASLLNYDMLYLTTFGDVKWNEPFYSKNGFTTISHSELPRAIRFLIDMETAMGMVGRIAMRCRIQIS